eukprot:SAG31_NODE_3996_length_3679_cov_1.092179_3_plen_139_part_00
MDESTGDAFRLLARYIGVFGDPANQASQGTDSAGLRTRQPLSSQSEKVEMTAPVLLETRSEKIAMTAPVLMKPENSASNAVTERSMSFILPSKYQSVADCPIPTDSRVAIKQLPARIQVKGHAALCFILLLTGRNTFG